MLDPQLAPFIRDWNTAWTVPPPGTSAAALRQRFEEIALAWRDPQFGDVETEVLHAEHEGRRVRVRVFRYGADRAAPCLLYFHGGGWLRGSPETIWDTTCAITKRNRQVVVSVDYALAPENPFPAAVDDGRAVAGWLASHARELGIDPSAIAVGGDSSGANIAAALTLPEAKSPIAFTAQLLIYPPTDSDPDRPSSIENADGPLLLRQAMQDYWKLYCTNGEDRTDPLAAPLLAPDLSSCPPAFVAVAEHDVLRDSGLAYADKLRRHGVDVVTDAGTGLLHGYLFAVNYCDAARACLDRMCAWLDGINSSARAARARQETA